MFLALVAQAYRKPAGGAGGAGGGKDKKVAKFELTEEQKQEIREAFDLFDTDGSGEYGCRVRRALSPSSWLAAVVT